MISKDLRERIRVSLLKYGMVLDDDNKIREDNIIKGYFDDDGVFINVAFFEQQSINYDYIYAGTGICRKIDYVDHQTDSWALMIHRYLSNALPQ